MGLVRHFARHSGEMAGNLGSPPDSGVITAELPHRAQPGHTLLPNLTSFGVAYFTIDTNARRKEGEPVTALYDVDFLNSQPAVYESDFIRIVTFDTPLAIGVNGLKGTGVVLKP